MQKHCKCLLMVQTTILIKFHFTHLLCIGFSLKTFVDATEKKKVKCQQKRKSEYQILSDQKGHMKPLFKQGCQDRYKMPKS